MTDGFALRANSIPLSATEREWGGYDVIQDHSQPCRGVDRRRGKVQAQAPAAPPPYGPPITVEQAKQVAAAGLAALGQ